MKPLVISHAHCTDGFGAAFAAWKKFGDEAEYLFANYGEEIDIETWHMKYALSQREVYIIDFSFPRKTTEYLFQIAKKVVWLDHHKTAFEMWCGKEYLDEHSYYGHDYDGGSVHWICLDNNKSGALLAWEFFHPNTEVPMLIEHIDDRDRWQFKIEGSKELHCALASYKPWSFEQWDEFRVDTDRQYGRRPKLLTEGAAILRAQEQMVKGMAKGAVKCVIPAHSEAIGAVLNHGGLAINTNCHMSEVGHELANASGTFGLVYYIGSNGKVKCSLRSNAPYDVSAIAKAFGGGGHAQAAGFEIDIDTLMGWLK